jgi:hypothetical protein
LFGTSNLYRIARGDVGSDGFSVALNRFGGDLQSGQNFQLLATTIEAGVAADQRQHAA